MDKISIIVPVFHVEQYLNRCIKSIIDQTYKNLEIILVDDGSDDACPEICDSWEKKDSRIKAIHKTNGGLSSARNAGLAVASGSMVGFVDSDDWIHPRMYEILHYALETHPSCQIAECMYKATTKLELYPQINEINEIIWTQKEMLDHFFRKNGYYYNPVVWTKLLRRSVLEGFSYVNTVNEDWEATYEWYKKADNLVFINYPLYYYFFNKNGIINSRFQLNRMGYLSVWDRLVEKTTDDFPEYLKEARLCRKRANYTLLCQYVLNGPAEESTVYKKTYQELRHAVKADFYILWKALSPLSRKILLILVIFTPTLAHVVGQLRRKYK